MDITAATSTLFPFGRCRICPPLAPYPSPSLSPSRGVPTTSPSRNLGVAGSRQGYRMPQNSIPKERMHWGSFLFNIGTENPKGAKNEDLLIAFHNPGSMLLVFLQDLKSIFRRLASRTAVAPVLFWSFEDKMAETF